MSPQGILFFYDIFFNKITFTFLFLGTLELKRAPDSVIPSWIISRSWKASDVPSVHPGLGHIVTFFMAQYPNGTQETISESIFT